MAVFPVHVISNEWTKRYAARTCGERGISYKNLMEGWKGQHTHHLNLRPIQCVAHNASRD